jgi:hypothetical protein
MTEKQMSGTKTSEKPVVYYGERDTYFGPLVIGESAFLYDVENHYNPQVEGKHVRTSPVVAVGENGSFETENTLYKRKEQ